MERENLFFLSGWENVDRWSSWNQPIRFEDFGYRTAEMLEKKKILLFSGSKLNLVYYKEVLSVLIGSYWSALCHLNRFHGDRVHLVAKAGKIIKNGTSTI